MSDHKGDKAKQPPECRPHPRQFLHSLFERQLELNDLWPSDQEKFRKDVDAWRAALAQHKEK